MNGFRNKLIYMVEDEKGIIKYMFSIRGIWYFLDDELMKCVVLSENVELDGLTITEDKLLIDESVLYVRGYSYEAFCKMNKGEIRNNEKALLSLILNSEYKLSEENGKCLYIRYYGETEKIGFELHNLSDGSVRKLSNHMHFYDFFQDIAEEVEQIFKSLI